MVIQNLDRKNRLVTMFTDHLIMTFVIGLLEGPAIFIRIIRLQHSSPGFMQIFPVGVYDIFAFSLYFCKDMVEGRSIAKRILGFQILNDETGQPAGPLRCLVRNLTLIIWPIELIVAVVNVDRRIGDRLAGTRLAVYDPKLPPRVDWAGMLASVLLGMVFVYVICVYPMQLLFDFFLTHQ